MLEEDQRIDPAEIHQIDVQEVAGDDGVGLHREELTPCRPGSARRRAYAGSGQDLPDCGSTDPVPELSRLAPPEDFSAAIEAQVTEHVLGERRHGLDSLLPGTE
ncbi:hypothetical protein SSPO_078740 [Streptomyces antimycoticus]|uniref:Uncharacterized protein n=1 Tax=Streptomyces antimycoticus TaxID=68175 RepID=A0A499VAB0_9ACTN|nr:hypothetical protein SSPO_078740 [Streptomyces antimycoticus]